MSKSTANKKTFVISPREGFRVNHAESENFVAILTDIAKKVGHPGEAPTEKWRKELVDRARPKWSPIHHKFEWDDTKAGEQWRLNQAAYYIRAFEFQYVDETGKKSPAVRWLPTIELTKGHSPGGPRAPIRMQDAFDDKRAMDSLVDTALREMKSWIRRYEALSKVAKLAPIFKAARKILKEDD